MSEAVASRKFSSERKGKVEFKEVVGIKEGVKEYGKSLVQSI